MRPVAKRAFDLVVSLTAIVVLLPVLLAIALAIKLDSRGPVLYRQQRIGRGGRPFVMLKFRSMRSDADRIAPNVSPAGDPRITRAGAFLRRWYLDELPQLWNVATGDMSMVGPRPETPEYVAMYSAEELGVLSVRPGIAGPSTLAFMDEGLLLASSSDAAEFYVTNILHHRVRLDLEYVRSRASLATDLRLLLRQAAAIVVRG
ncbi:MAG: sugar transferase [Actinomycetota bacterium]